MGRGEEQSLLLFFVVDLVFGAEIRDVALFLCGTVGSRFVTSCSTSNWSNLNLNQAGLEPSDWCHVKINTFLASTILVRTYIDMVTLQFGVDLPCTRNECIFHGGG